MNPEVFLFAPSGDVACQEVISGDFPILLLCLKQFQHNRGAYDVPGADHQPGLIY